MLPPGGRLAKSRARGLPAGCSDGCGINEFTFRDWPAFAKLVLQANVSLLARQHTSRVCAATCRRQLDVVHHKMMSSRYRVTRLHADVRMTVLAPCPLELSSVIIDKQITRAIANARF
jgi:hypothetical protein